MRKKVRLLFISFPHSFFDPFEDCFFIGRCKRMLTFHTSTYFILSLDFIFENVLAQIRVSSDLDCAFSAHCRWSNGSMAGSMLPENVGWSLMSDSKADDRFPLSDGKTENTFAFTSAPPGQRHEIWLVSDVVGCQLGGARLKFWYYYTGKNARLDVCTRSPPGSTDMSKHKCFPYEAVSGARAQQWSLATLMFPPMSQSMEILLKATFETPNNLVAVDDITYEAILCESTSSGSAQGAGGQIDQALGDDTYKIPVQLPSAAEQIMSSLDDHRSSSLAKSSHIPLLMEFSNARSSQPHLPHLGVKSHQATVASDAISNCGLDCNFDTNHFCNYEIISKEEEFQFGWLLSNRPISNPLTGIQHDSRGKGGFFAYAGNSKFPEHAFVLKSKKNMLNGPRGSTTLQFQYYLAGVRGRLLVCFVSQQFAEDTEKEEELKLIKLLTSGLNNSRLCPFEQNGVNMHTDSRQWRADTHQIYFIADHLPKNYIIGLDEIHLMDKFGRVPATCAGGNDDSYSPSSTTTSLLHSISTTTQSTSINVEDYFQ